MRRRTTAAVQQPMFDPAAVQPTVNPWPASKPTATAALPDNIEVERGIAYIQCPSCSLKQSEGIAKKPAVADTGASWQCMRCDGDLEVTAEHVAAAKAAKKDDRPVAQDTRHTQTCEPAGNGRATPAGAAPGSNPGGAVTNQAAEVEAPRVIQPPKPVPGVRDDPMENISEFVGQVRSRGYDLDLITAAGWGTAQRAAVRMFINAGGPIPTCLAVVPKVANGESVARKQPPTETRVSVAGNKSSDEKLEITSSVVTATWGEERFSPVQYNTFSVGPFTASTTPRPGESMSMALARLTNDLEEYAKNAFKVKRQAFLERLKQSGDR